ncbi:MAG TPA: hypothetical protein VIU39_06330, partial [Anaerolineales bacterium]
MRRLGGRETFFLVFTGTAAVVILTALLLMNLAAARAVGRGGDLLLPWRAARGFQFEKLAPYGGGIASDVQNLVYGRSAQPGENPYILHIPFQSLLLYFPLGFLSQPLMARAAHMLVSEAALLGLIYMSLYLTEWKPRRLFMLLFYLTSALSFYTLASLTEGNAALLLGLAYAGILLAVRSGRDELAGALAALCLQHLAVGGPFLLLVLVRVFRQQRWGVLTGLFMTLFVLTALAFLFYPGWGMAFVRASLADLRWYYGFTPGWIFMHLWPDWGARLGWALTAVGAVVLGAEWGRARGADWPRFHWTACLTLAVTPLLGMRSEMQNLAVLSLPWALIAALVRERWKAGYWMGGVLLLAVFAAPWLLLRQLTDPGL